MPGRALLGQFPNGESGLRVSRPGYEVTDMNLPPKALAFDSRWPKALNVHQQGTASHGQTVGFPALSEPPFVVAVSYDSQGRYRTAGCPATTSSFVAQSVLGSGTVGYWVFAL